MIFDLDGVITFTARVHAAAWKELFDDYLRARAARISVPFRPFDAAADYYAYVDGKPRYDGVQSFLKSRAIEIPYGSPSNSRFAHELRNSGIRVGLASSSRNAVPILKKAGILNLFHAIVDVWSANVFASMVNLSRTSSWSALLNWIGRSLLNPPLWSRMRFPVWRPGGAGGFALVLGVDRHHTGALEQHGANWAINDFRKITADQVSAFFTARARAA